jgi:hypothetical protein
MQQSLESFLEESGFTDIRSELARFFDSPSSYQMALEKRLVNHLSRKGKEAFKTNQNQALELFNRVLSLDPKNEEVISLLGRISRRRRALQVAGLLATSAALAGIIIVASRIFGDADPAISQDEALDANATLDAAAGQIDAAPDATVHNPAAVFDAATTAAIEPRPDPIRVRPDRPRKDVADAAPPEPARTFRLLITPRGSEYRVDGGAWTKLTQPSASLSLPSGPHTLSFRNDTCCQSEERSIRADQPGGRLNVNLRFLPASITPVCNVPGVRVQINQKNARLGIAATIPIERITGTESVDLRFFTSERIDHRTITVSANQEIEEPCKL